METKVINKINYGKLVNSSRELVINKNFRNNQNYIISDFTKFRFYRAYYKNWFNENVGFGITFLFGIGLFIPFILKLFNLSFSYEIALGFYMLLGSTFILLMFSIIFEGIFYYLYKKIRYILGKQKFTSNRYIFFKNPKKKSYNLNRRDFISFKK